MAELTPQEVFGTGSPFTALAEELEAMYPLTNPSQKDEDRLIMYRAGQRSVVEYILAKQTNV